MMRAPKLPVIQGITIPAKGKDPQANACIKSVLLRPISCDCDPCDKYKPFERIVCQTGWIEPWNRYLEKQKRKAAKAWKICHRHGVYPSWPMFMQLSLSDYSVDDIIFASDARRQERIMSYYIGMRVVEYANNFDAVAEAAARPRHRLDLGSMMDGAEIAENIVGKRHYSGDDVDEEMDAVMPGMRQPKFAVKEAEMDALTTFTRYSASNKLTKQLQVHPQNLY